VRYPVNASATERTLPEGEALRDHDDGDAAAAERSAAAVDDDLAGIALLSVDIRYENDVVLARQRARQLSELLGFDTQDQTRVATVVSELARNAYEYAGGGRVNFLVQESASGSIGEPIQSLLVRVNDTGPGIADVQAVLDGRYVSRTGMGLGLVGARRLSDDFRIETQPQRGTTVEVSRILPRGAPRVSPADAVRIVDQVAGGSPRGAYEEVRQQNQELVRALEELRTRQAEVEHLNRELAETNRGVLALYAELDDRAQDLKRISEYKSRFLSDVSHEFRTPLTYVLNMTRFLLDGADGQLSADQDHRVTIILQSVESMSELVYDLLDLAKIEAGRTTTRPSWFTVSELFAGLRGMFRPLVTSQDVTLVFDDGDDIPEMWSDQQRISQVMRNFVSNAIKFTEHGEIRVTALREQAGDCVRLVVKDAGIGIAAADHERIFQEFAQVDGPIQRRVRGTGLGLSLAQKLAVLLGGRIELQSEPGVGSTFSLVVPRALPGAAGEDGPPEASARSANGVRYGPEASQP